MRSAKDKPYVENYPPLKKWLDKHKARCDWQLPLGDPEEPNAYVEQWQFARGKIAIIMVSARQLGWDIFTSSFSGLIVGTLEDAEKRLGL